MMYEHNAMAARNEKLVEECLKQINTAPDAEQGVRRLLQYLGEKLECDRVYVFEEMDRLHISNTYEWCRESITSGIKQLPYLAKKDLLPWFTQLENGRNIIEPDVTQLRSYNPVLYEFMKSQGIHSIILSPLMENGKMVGFLGIDNPPKEHMKHISVLFDVLAYFVSSLMNRRELQRLRKEHEAKNKTNVNTSAKEGELILLIDDSPELLKLNKRILRMKGYQIITAETLKSARQQLTQHHPSTIVLDIDLPDGNGIDFCRELNGRIPVVFLTAHADEQEAKEGLKAGGYAFLTKPYLIEDLQNAVADAIKKKVSHTHIINSINEKEESII